MDSGVRGSARPHFIGEASLTEPILKDFAFPVATVYSIDSDLDLDKLFKAKSVQSKLNSQYKIVHSFKEYKYDLPDEDFSIENDGNFQELLHCMCDMYDGAYEGNIAEQEQILNMLCVINRPIESFFNTNIQFVDDDEIELEDDDPEIEEDDAELDDEDDEEYDEDDDEFEEGEEEYGFRVKGSIISAVYQDEIIDDNEIVSPVACIFSIVVTFAEELYVLNFNFNRRMIWKDKQFVCVSDLAFKNYVNFNELHTSNIINTILKPKKPIILKPQCTTYSSSFNKDDLKIFDLLDLLLKVSVDTIAIPHIAYRAVKPLNTFVATDIVANINGSVMITDNYVLSEFIEDYYETDTDMLLESIESFGSNGELRTASSFTTIEAFSDEEENFLNSTVADMVDSLPIILSYIKPGETVLSLEKMIEEHYNYVSSSIGDIRNLEDRIALNEEVLETVKIVFPHLYVKDITEIPLWYFLLVIPCVIHVYNANECSLYLEDETHFCQSKVFIEAVDTLKSLMKHNWN